MNANIRNNGSLIMAQSSNCISFGLTDIVALFASDVQFFRFRVFFRACSLLNEIGDPPFLFFTFLTQLTHQLSGKSFRKKSMLENCRTNVLKHNVFKSFLAEQKAAKLLRL